ncbi:MAG TPA: NAD(P)H-dependent oxidoreductase [Methanobacterium sp.]|jgi:flavodoxin|nr:NAD(P)H-dependent oxidoreductase [Methanobacterium sp.]HOI40164.1 NAD(P)H-dependent oxidoreductase [Methanobacterium sp.]
MKTLIACYSHTGKTLTVSEKLQEQIKADMTRIEPVKDRWYVIKAIHAYLEKKWPIKPCITDIDDYDCLIVCSPIWAGRTTPGVIQYLEELENTSGKKFAVLVTMGGDGSELATIQLRNGLEAKGMEFVDKLVINGSAQKSGEWEAITKNFAQKFME